MSQNRSSDVMHTLVFSNADAHPRNERIRCDIASVPHIMAWYGAYFAGDRYTVTLDGRNVRMDGNGEPVGDLPCPVCNEGEG